MMAEFYGKVSGTVSGAVARCILPTSASACSAPTASWVAASGLRRRRALRDFLKTSDVTVCFFGDGGINKGTFHEAMNFTGIRRLPVIFLCENNQFAQYTAAAPDDLGRHLAGRAVAYGVPGVEVDGNDALAVYPPR